MNMISFKNIRKSYGDAPILEDFSLEVPKGEFLTVIGSSGCGKTTILKLINGLLRPDSGEILVNGLELNTADLITLRRSIGYCIQGSALFPHLTVAENIAYVPSLIRKLGKRELSAFAERWLAFVGLDTSFADRYPEELSGGQQQRIGIARALANDPALLLMDEPFGAVDSITRNELQRELKKIHAQTEKTIVFVTHDIEEALFLGTQVLVLHEGTVMQYDTPDRIRKVPANAFVEQLLNAGRAGQS